MTDSPADPPHRIRVTRPPGQRPRRTTVTSEIDAQSEVGLVYMRSLIRAQLRLALGTMAALLLTVGLLPWWFLSFSGLRHARFLGLPVPWLLLGVCAYPVIGVLAWNYVRRAEQNEARFRDLTTPITKDDR